MKNLFPATRFVYGAVLQEEKDYTAMALVLPPSLTEAPPANLIERLEKSAEKVGDRVNENELAKTMIATGILNMDDIEKYTQVFAGKVKQTRASAWNRVKVNLNANPSLYKPYPGHEKLAKFVGFKDLGADHARKTYRLHKIDGQWQYMEVGAKFAKAVSSDVASVLSGGEQIETDDGLATVVTKTPEADQNNFTIPPPPEDLKTPVTPAPKPVPSPSETVPSGNVDSKEQDAKETAKSAEAKAVGDWLKNNTDVPVENKVETPATDVTNVGVSSVAQGVKEAVDEGKMSPATENPSEQSEDEADAGGGSLNALVARARSEKTKKRVDALKAKYSKKNGIKQTFDLDISDIADGEKKMVEIQNSKIQFEKKLEAVIGDMFFKAENMRNRALGLLLTGDPGTGKTTFIHQLSDAVGLPLIVIEAPHITKEHIIQIPFLVKRPFMPEASKYNMTGKDANPNTPEMEWQIENAESNIVTQMRKAASERRSKWTDDFWMDKIETKPQLDQAFEKNPDMLEQASIARQAFSCIFFVDEFFRTNDPNIRNLLRGIINGNIGNDKLPNDVYCIYAANMKRTDGSFDEIPKNMQFGGEVKFDNIPADEWGKSFFANKFGTELQVARQLRNKVESGEASPEEINEYNKSESTQALANLDVPIDTEFSQSIAEAVGDQLSVDMVDKKGLRTSPRRLEQICLCMNALKAEFGKHGFVNQKTINAFLRVQFREYMNGLVNEVAYKRVGEAVAKALGYQFDPEAVSDPSEWEDQMKVQLLLKERLGKFRKYPVMIAGEPGIGKTQIMKSACGALDIPVVSIEATTLTKASVVGMPISKEKVKTGVSLNGMDAKAKDITVEYLTQLASESGMTEREVSKYLMALEATKETEFAPPSAYRFILEQYFGYKREMREYEEDEANGVEESKRRGRKRPTGKYKVMLFIDELTRVEDMSIFNSLRMLLLEHKLGEKFPLPEDMMTSGALNPTDTAENVQELSDHMKDVLDIIPGEANWDKWYSEFLLKKADEMFETARDNYLKQINAGVDPNEAKMKNLLGLNPNNFARCTAKVLDLIADRCRIGQIVGEGDKADATRMKEKLFMVGKPSEKFFWQGVSINDTPVYINPRNMTSIFEKMVTMALSDKSINGFMTIQLCLALQKVDGKKRDPKMINTYVDKCILGYIEAFETQMRLQGQIQQTSENSMNETIRHFTQAVTSDDKNNDVRKIIEESLVGESVETVTQSLKEYFTKYEFEEENIQNYNAVERMVAKTTDVVKEFGDFVDFIKEKGIQSYVGFVSDLWSLVQVLDNAVKKCETDPDVDIREITEVSNGIKTILAKTYGSLFEPMVADEPSMTVVMTDDGFETNFIDPNLEYLKDVL